MSDELTVVTGVCRFSYVHLTEPWAYKPEDQPKYSVTLLIPKKDKATMKKIFAAEEAAKQLGKTSKWGGKIPRNLKSIIRDGDEEYDPEENPEYVGMYFMAVSSPETYPPGLVDKNRNEILDKTELYSGCWGRVQIRAFPYSGQSNGVSFGLNHVQKIRDGEPLGSHRGRAEDVFDDEYDGEEEEEDYI